MCPMRADKSYRVGIVRGLPAAAERPLPVTERGRRTRALIIDAAATLMYQRGVSMTSLDDVLAAAGSGKSQLYHYFDSKAELVAAVIERQLELVLAEQPSLQQIDSWDGINRWVAEILELHSAPGGPFACPLGTMAAELKNDEAFRPLLDAAFQQWEAPLARGLRRIQQRGELAAEADPARLATMAIAALQGGMLLARVRGDITPLRDAIDGAIAELHRWESKASRPRKRTSASSRKPRRQ
jgi:TetR/AcrR family transcriptional regulator, transcriptional repressor for nem operon